METAPAILRRPAVAGCALVALALVAYLPALDAGFVFDDTMYVLDDARIREPAGLWRIWTEVSGETYAHQWYPLTSSAWWLQWRLWGADPVGYHAVNVLLHGLCAVLLWRVLAAVRAPGAWLAGAIFAVHPVHVASVAWVSELKNVLSCALMLGSLLAFLRGARGVVPGWVLFVAALASKTATASLPAALGLLWFYRDGRLARRDVHRLALLAIVAVASVGLTACLEWQHRAGGEAFALGPGERVRVASAAAWFYAGKLAGPWNLAFVYPRWDPAAWGWWTWGLPASIALAVAGLWRWRARLGRGPFCAVLFYLVAVTPVSLANVAYTRHSFVADHWVYWGSMGLIALAAGAAAHAWARRRHAIAGAWMPRAAPCAASLLIALAGGLTWRRATVFESPRTLWEDTVRRNARCQLAHYNLAVALTAAGEITRALGHYANAARLDPRDADVYNGLGDALMRAGDVAGACRAFGRALALEPHYPEAHYNLGNALKRAGHLEAAMVHYRLALVQRPGYSGAHNNLGTALLAAGDRDRALAHFRAALRADPGNLSALHNLELGVAP